MSPLIAAIFSPLQEGLCIFNRSLPLDFGARLLPFFQTTGAKLGWPLYLLSKLPVTTVVDFREVCEVDFPDKRTLIDGLLR